jgi:hypothetical protein
MKTRRQPGASESEHPSRPMSFLISAVGLVLAVTLLFAYVFLAPRLISANFQNQFYYIVLIVAGLVAAAFLVGGMRSYDAHVTYKRFGLIVQAGGAVAVFLMVVGIGLYAIPKLDTFNLTIRPIGPHQQSIKTGNVTIQYGDKTDTEAVGQNGEANFKQIPQTHWGRKIKITPEIDGYDERPQFLVLNSVVLELPLLSEYFETRFFGTIRPSPSESQIVKILVEGEDQEATADEFGRFSLVVHKKEGTRVRVKVYINSKQVYDNFEILPGPVTLTTHRPL